METKKKENEELKNRINETCIYNTYSDDFDHFEENSKEKILMILLDETKEVSLWDKNNIIPECNNYDIMQTLIENDNLNRIMLYGNILIIEYDDCDSKVIILKLNTAREIYYDRQRSLKLKKLKNMIGKSLK
jgi:hypothetical protein